MFESMHFSFTCNLLKWFFLKNTCVIIQRKIIKNLWFTNEKACINPITITIWLLFERDHFICVGVNMCRSEFTSRFKNSHRQYSTTRLMTCNSFRYIQICHSITISKTKALLTNISLYAFDASSSHCIKTSIYHRYLPIFRMIVMHHHRIVRQVDRHITIMTVIVSKILFYNILLITTTHDKLRNSVMAVDFHYMPYYWLAPYLYHRFGY